MATDQQLVATFLQYRSEKAFRQLYSAKAPALYQLALRLCKNEGLVNEVLQETWVRAIQKLPDFQWKSTLKTWLIGILINTERELYRQTQRNHKPPIVKKKNFESSNSDKKIDLENAVSQLPRGYREAIILHDIEGYTHKEIAALLGTSEGTSKSQLFQARKRLRSILSEYNYH